MITTLLVPEAILIQSEARSSEEIITQLGNHLLKLGRVRDDFVEATLRREASMPTGLPLGGDFNAALPHVDLEYVKAPALALATLKQPVEFRNMVDPEEIVPVQLVIMLALDQPHAQIEMLQQVATLFQSPEIVSRLMEASSPVGVLDILKSSIVENS